MSRYQPALTLNVHVGDVTTRVVHECRADASCVFVEAGAMLVGRIEGDKKPDFSMATSRLLANGEEPLRMAAKGHGEEGRNSSNGGMAAGTTIR